MASFSSWRVCGSYLEACNCDAVCPCRREGDRSGGRSTLGRCEFVLSWDIHDGAAADLDLSGHQVVMLGWYDDDEPRSPWRVILYVDSRADDAQREALSSIFLGRAGGTTLRNFAAAIGEVHAVHAADISLDHDPVRRTIEVGSRVAVRTRQVMDTAGAVSCGIPGHDHPGSELVMEVMRVNDELSWEYSGKCGFATDFDYSSDG
ncbi:MAG: DUF1326 domain-containing protein [Actinomycetota bacterium]|nr:DUF1326 domain-containing protein [Actinomycetota bacterium]